MSLTDTQIKKSRCGDKPVKMFDGDGLFLHLMPTGSKIWRVAYRIGGSQKMLTLGKYPEITLSQARDLCLEACWLEIIGHHADARQLRDGVTAIIGVHNATSYE